MSELVLELRMAASPRQVFAAFEAPFLLRRWYGAPPGCFRTGADGNVGAGEPFQVNLIDAQGTPFMQRGRILDVVPAERLELEMSWEGGHLGQEVTRAVLNFHPADGGTRFEVRQGPFRSPEALEAHRAYWKASLERLSRVASGEAVPCFEEFWDESGGYTGRLGVATYAVLAGMREAGAAPEALAQVEELLYTHLSRLPSETAELLGAVLHSRLTGLS
ncbi:SRPBCC family protein [Stigmatella aurantiaca]|uniref:Activator of Hsp90 ATPase 1 family protein n=1 Tax=Stigmatella aurantiaca (strain DW4/3-1) TaxID=378806 RepID=Q08N99_STIAD|nr:SRPBCC domain-containing protein [Stigmatella aurantiaca]ADO72142.1 Activator of Hsp90 ATPase 1 family protein [Stigmatella aurantiaca DW4/3-1]EAU61960.1 transcriptional regulator, ArsR family, putative [Stigmatella aurantiaca DW4/3-1]